MIGFASRVGIAAAAVIGAAGGVRAQEAILTDAATQPATGRVTLRSQYRFKRFDQDASGDRPGRQVNQHAFRNLVTYGVTRDLSFSADFIAITRDDIDSAPDLGPNDDDGGVMDLRTLFKWRFWQHDPGPVDTRRLALVAGMEWPTGTGDLSSHSFDPIVGLVYTAIKGRHGFNQSVSYLMSTSTLETNILPGQNADDLLEFDSAYLFRLSPAEYADDTHGALYATLELEGYYETGGDREILLSPGLMYEARRWTAEVGVRLPVHQQVRDRPEVDYGVVFGFRYLF